MTRAHAKLLGPCFKTGRIGGRLAHRDTASAHRDNATDRQRKQSHATTHEAASLSCQQCAQAETVRSATAPATGLPAHRFPPEWPSERGSSGAGAALGAYRQQMQWPAWQAHARAPSSRTARASPLGQPPECCRVTSTLSVSFSAVSRPF